MRLLPDGRHPREEEALKLAAGDLVLLVDRRGRRYLVTLEAGGVFHSHHGTLDHDVVIGTVEGSEVESSMGRRLRVLRPTLADYVVKMPRGAQVVYPKDVGAIVVEADIFPGARVLEAGTGSGSLTLALMRAVGSKGTIHTFDVREDFQSKALRNIERYAGSDPTYGQVEARIADIYEDASIDLEVDRVVLDLAEPWRALPAVDRCLRPGGILCSYMPTVPQVQNLVAALEAGWTMVRTFETLQRGWNVEGLSVRPDHRMVAHTAFLVVARKVVAADG